MSGRESISEEEYFSRQISLWGEDVQKSLRDKRIAIIGCGGLGSTLALALGCSGIGEITLVDFDTVSAHNIHRQIAFGIDDIGKNKAAACAALLKNKNPFLESRAMEYGFDEFTAEESSGYDLLLDATDNFQTREKMDKWAKKTDTPWIYASVEEFNGQVCFFRKSDFSVFNNSKHSPGGVTAPVVMHIGSFQADMALRYLAGMPIAEDTLYYFFLNENGELGQKRFSLPVK